MPGPGRPRKTCKQTAFADIPAFLGRARSSVGEHFVDIEGVAGSIPAAPTISVHVPPPANPARGFRFEVLLLTLTIFPDRPVASLLCAPEKPAPSSSQYFSVYTRQAIKPVAAPRRLPARPPECGFRPRGSSGSPRRESQPYVRKYPVPWQWRHSNNLHRAG